MRDFSTENPAIGPHFSQNKTQHLLLLYPSASPPPASLPRLQPRCSLLVPGRLEATQCLFCVPGTLFQSIHKAQPLSRPCHSSKVTFWGTCPATTTFKLCGPTFLMPLMLPYHVPYHCPPNRLKCADVPSGSSNQHIHTLQKGIFLSFRYTLST